jgi:hypothetical protein
MQPGEKIAPKSTGRKAKQSVKTHHLSSFGILNRNGLEINNGRDLPAIEEGNEKKLSEFSDWSMPEQPMGYIQGRVHDFF